MIQRPCNVWYTICIWYKNTFKKKKKHIKTLCRCINMVYINYIYDVYQNTGFEPPVSSTSGGWCHCCRCLGLQQHTLGTKCDWPNSQPALSLGRIDGSLGHCSMAQTEMWIIQRVNLRQNMTKHPVGLWMRETQNGWTLLSWCEHDKDTIRHGFLAWGIWCLGYLVQCTALAWTTAGPTRASHLI